MTPLTEPPELALWLWDHAPIHRISVSPGAKVYPDPERVQVIVQGTGAARLIAWADLEPIVTLAITKDSVLQLHVDLLMRIPAWHSFLQSDHCDMPVKWEYEDKLPKDIGRAAYHQMFEKSSVRDGVRMFPYVEIAGARRHYLRAL